LGQAPRLPRFFRLPFRDPPSCLYGCATPLPVVTLVSMPTWLNLANLFTLIRLLLTPVTITAIVEGRHQMALVIFFTAAVTDILDGWAARGRGASTAAGAYFDPIADKFLMSGVFVALAASGITPWWVVLVVLGRDLYIVLGASILIAFTKIRKFPPSVWGKVSTFVQIVTVTCWLTRDAFPAPWLRAIGEGVVWPCVAATVWSGLHYTWRGIRMVSAN
jgi:cardiolipin synthase (CMP-forming)